MIRRGLACISRLQILPKKLPYIPDDIIFEILSRLPAKSVMKFRRVCKKWLHLTSSPYFTEIHCRRAAPILLAQCKFGMLNTNMVRQDLFLIDQDAKDKKHVVKSLATKIKSNDRYMVVASGDGLIVLALKRRYLVCNMITGEQVIVEPPPAPSPGYKSAIFAVFFDPPTGDYRMLFWRRTRRYVHSSYKIWIYSFKDKAWRDLSTIEHLPSMFVNPVVLDNTLHWMASCTYCLCYQDLHDATSRPCKTPIIAFDMVSEKFRLMHYPPEVDDCCPGKKLHETIYLLDINGQLTLCSISFGFVELWILEDYDKQSWARKHRIELEWDVEKYPFRFRNFDPTYFNSRVKRPAIGDGELLVKWLLKGLTQYQLDDETVRKLEDEAKDPLALININSCCIFTYKPTFASLHSGIINHQETMKKQHKAIRFNFARCIITPKKQSSGYYKD